MQMRAAVAEQRDVKSCVRLFRQRVQVRHVVSQDQAALALKTLMCFPDKDSKRTGARST
jgi:hypothetical protein